MSRASPISQCGLRSRRPWSDRHRQLVRALDRLLAAGACPHVRTVTFASSPPTGTSGSAGFGIRRRRSSTWASTVASSASRAVRRVRADLGGSGAQAATSGPSGRRAALDRLADLLRGVFRSARSVSPSPWSSRRRVRASAGSTSAESSPRRSRPSGSRRLLTGRCEADAHPNPLVPASGRASRGDRRRTPDRGWRGAIPRAARSGGRGTRGRARRRRVAVADRRSAAVSKMAVCHASPRGSRRGRPRRPGSRGPPLLGNDAERRPRLPREAASR